MSAQEPVHIARRPGGRGVLEGAFAVLEELSRLGEAGLSTLAAATGLPKATTHRLLDQLVALGSVQRHERRYRLGARMARIGQAWRPDTALRDAAARPLRELAVVAPAASLSVSVLEGDDVVVLCGMTGEVHDLYPLHRGATLPPATAAEQVLTTWVPSTSPGRYSASEWRRMVALSRVEGVAFDRIEESSVSCVAAPVFGRDGAVVAAVGVSLLSERRVRGLAEGVVRAAAMASANLSR